MLSYLVSPLAVLLQQLLLVHSQFRTQSSNPYIPGGGGGGASVGGCLPDQRGIFLYVHIQLTGGGGASPGGGGGGLAP